MATRVPLQVVNGEGEEEVRTPLYKVLRSGKRIIATTLKKASRVAASPRAVKGAQAARVLSPEQDEERSTAPDSDELGTACKATAEDVLEEPADDAPSATEGVGITVEDASQGLGEASTAQHAPAAGSPPPLATTDIILKEVAHVLSESIATGVCKADDAQQLGCAAAPVSTTVPPQPSLLSGTAEQRHELDTTLPPSAHEVQECQPALSTPQTAPGEAGARSDTELITPPVVPADHDSSSDEAAAPDEGLHAVDAEDDAEETALPPAHAAGGEGQGVAFIPRGEKRTPYMERKLRNLQAEKPSARLSDLKTHKSALELDKEAATAARKENNNDSAEKRAAHRLAQQIIGRAVETQGKGLGESLVVHKSRLEREKEAALAAQEAARSGAPGGSHQKCALPGYMRATAASSAMQRSAEEPALGGGQPHRSRLERERDAVQARRKQAGVNPATPFPVKGVRAAGTATAAASFGVAGLGDLPLRKSGLERAKEDAARRAATAPGPRRLPPSSRAAAQAAGQAGRLADMKPAKSRLEREQEAWARAAAAHGKPARGTSMAS